MKKKGFTLIELLAVIVILAILAFILIPVIQDLIANARYAAAADSVLNYVHAANTQATVDVGGFEDYKLNLSDTYELETEIDDDELAKIKYSGKGPDYVYMLFSGDDKYVSEGHFCMWGYSIDYNFETGASKSDLDYCGNGSQEPEGPQSCDVLRNNEYDTTTIFKIKNVEDLVCISEIAKTKSFLEKTIYLIKDIDFNDDSSYEDPNGTTYGDINGNGEVEGLKTELTTSAGFYPIGSQTVPFKGIFKGYANSISNLMISRNQNNVGLFGYNQGKISGLNVTSTVTGSSNVGGVVGYNDSGVINEIIFDGSVNSFDGGTTYGGIVGYSDGGEIKSILVKNFETNNETVVCTNAAPAAGKTANGTVITGVVEKGSLYRNNCSGKAVGRNSNGSFTIYVSNLVTATSGPGLEGYGGTDYTLNSEMLNAYDKVLDTYIGGDNDNSGYYFDYENETSSNIVLKRTEKNPIKFTLKGEGTSSSPYIIDSIQHYKEASTLAGKDDSYKLKITEDLNFTDRHYYALGTNGNLLNSDIDGDMHTLSNISFGCAENCGLVSQNSHTIEGLNINNLTIKSSNSNVGGVVGYNTGTIKGINLDRVNILAYHDIGGVVGYNTGTINEITFSGTVNFTSAGTTYGGIVGYSDGGEIKSILVKNFETNNETVVCTNAAPAAGKTANGTVITGVVEKGSLYRNNCSGKAVGRNSNGSFTIYVSNLVTATSGPGLEGYGGTDYTLNSEMLNAYDKVLDTYIGGDNDNSGYYFDYENDNINNIVIKSIKHDPITFTLSGNGTKENPYIIDSYKHYKEASILAGSENNYNFKVTADIDFDGKHYYALGTNGNILTSDINGDMHTLSNISFGCAENCGLVSQNSHTIEGLNINNLTIKSSNSNVGGVVGSNTGTIKGINLDRANILGYHNIGGVVGNNTGTINEITFSGTVNFTSAGTTYGGIVGYSDGGEIKSILVKNFETNNETVVCTNAAPAAGKTANGTVITGVVEKGSLYRNNCSGKAVGRNSDGSFTVYVSNLVTATSGPGLQGYGGIGYTLVPPTTVTYSGGEIDTLTYYDNEGLMDTVIGGDNDGSGYYLQYNNSGDGIIVVKASSTPTPSPTPDPGSGEPLEETKVGNNPPTCVLEQVISRENGIQPVLTCTDDDGAPTIRSQWNVNKNATTNQFSDIGIVKNGTVNGNSKTVRPYWSTSDPISVPTPNTCYYFRFGAQDASGNWSYYVTSKCYYGFGRSND